VKMQPRMCSQFLVSRPCKTSSPLPCFIGDAFSYRSDHNKWKNQRLPKMRHPTIIQRRPFLREKTDDLGYFEVAKTPKWGLNSNQVLIYGATMSCPGLVMSRSPGSAAHFQRLSYFSESRPGIV
jgi:hypothetical protein